MSKLFTPIAFRGITLKNRIVVSPMCQYSATDGFAGDWHMVHYGSRAAGGAALIIQEATAVSPEGRITPGDLGLYHDGQMEKLRSIVRFIKEQGSVAGIQLAHAGRKASCARPWEGGMQLREDAGGWTTVAPSAISFNADDRNPVALEKPDIDKIVCDFTLAAGRALQAGYQVVEIHAAHGYLIHEFLSPISNQRTDSYGGTFENRIRLLLRIVKAVRSVWPKNLPLFVRISATDWVPGGWHVDEAVLLASILKDMGVDLIDTSSGGMVPWAEIPFGPGYQVPFASRIRNEAGIPAGAVGLVTGARQAEEILANGHADLILIGRLSLRDPYFALHAAGELGENTGWPVQYLRGKM